MNHPRPLELATKSYYWKPAVALFRALELSTYYDSDVILNSPTLDLGCGDGSVARMLEEAELTEESLCGLDISQTQLRKAQQESIHLNLLQADANHLPFRDEYFSSVFCNGVLCAIPGGVEQSLSEINRVLKQGGIFVATIPTDEFVEVLFWPQALKRFSHKLSSLYTRKLNYRLQHHNPYYSQQQWKKRVEDSGFSVAKIGGFFSHRAGFIYELINMQVFRIFGFLKHIKHKNTKIIASNLLKKSLKKVYIEDLQLGSRFGYMLIVAQKKK
jgi:ubiquinone/menaquinone biosynthesis C-methylase UbiE